MPQELICSPEKAGADNFGVCRSELSLSLSEKGKSPMISAVQHSVLIQKKEEENHFQIHSMHILEPKLT